MKTHLTETVEALKAANSHILAAKEGQPRFVVDLLNALSQNIQGTLNYAELLLGVLAPKPKTTKPRGPSKLPKRRRP